MMGFISTANSSHFFCSVPCGVRSALSLQESLLSLGRMEQYRLLHYHLNSEVLDLCPFKLSFQVHLLIPSFLIATVNPGMGNSTIPTHCEVKTTSFTRLMGFQPKCRPLADMGKPKLSNLAHQAMLQSPDHRMKRLWSYFRSSTNVAFFFIWICRHE